MPAPRPAAPVTPLPAPVLAGNGSKLPLKSRSAAGSETQAHRTSGRCIDDGEGPGAVRGVDEIQRDTRHTAPSIAPPGFRLLLGTNPLPMWVYEQDSLRFLEVNEAAVKRYGYSHEQFLSMRISDIRTDEEFWPLEINIRSDREATSRSGPWHHRTAAGEDFEIEITSHIVNWDGRVAVLDSILDLGRGRAGDFGDDAIGRLAGGPALLEHLKTALEQKGCRVVVVVIAFDRLERIGGSRRCDRDVRRHGEGRGALGSRLRAG